MRCRATIASLGRALALAVVLAPVAGLAGAAEYQPHSSITGAVENFLLAQQDESRRGQLEITVHSLDPRLRLAACDHPPEAFLPPGGRATGNTTVGVRCQAPRPWSLYVPATVAQHETVLVAARPLPRGTVLQESDLTTTRRDVAQLSQGYLTDIGAAQGMVVTRPIAQNTVLSPGLIAPPRLVRRGDAVTIRAITGGIEVQMKGEALADGGQGDRIRVRNLSSGSEIEAVVRGAGSVEVRL